MANKHDQDDELIVDVEEVYSKTETFIEDNKNTLIGVVAVLALIIGGYFGYTSLYLKPLQEEAQQEMFMAEKYFAMDSLNKAINGDGVYPGFLQIADDYSATKAGNLANYYLGISFLKTGQFEAAIEALNNFDSSDEVVGSMALGATGDAYMELGDLNKAASFYKKAADRRDNDFTTPLFLMKAGNTYELLGEYNDALGAYKLIKDEYKKSAEANEIEKYISRAESYIQ